MTTQIVVVEDQPDILGLVRDVLEGRGYVVVGVDNADSAAVDASDSRQMPLLLDLLLSGTGEVRLFLIDLMLTGMSGIELAGYLRTHGFASTPMIAMSASPLMREIAAQSGLFQDIVAKPFSLEALIEVIEREILNQ